MNEVAAKIAKLNREDVQKVLDTIIKRIHELGRASEDKRFRELQKRTRK